MIINDQTNNDLLYPSGLAHGLDPGPGYGSAAGYGLEEFPSSLLIPESDWPTIIKERHSTLRHLAYNLGGVKIKNQGSLPYCWIFATTSAVEVIRAAQNEPYLSLSPASCGAKITNYRKRGGYGLEAIEGLKSYGAVPSSLWPDTDVNQRLDTPQTREAAAKNKPDEWWYCSTWQAIGSAILRFLPVSVGLNWWSHQVNYLDLTLLDGEPCPDFANSWSESWGSKGFGTLQGRKKYPADGVCPRSALPVFL